MLATEYSTPIGVFYVTLYYSDIPSKTIVVLALAGGVTRQVTDSPRAIKTSSFKVASLWIIHQMDAKFSSLLSWRVVDVVLDCLL